MKVLKVTEEEYRVLWEYVKGIWFKLERGGILWKGFCGVWYFVDMCF